MRKNWRRTFLVVTLLCASWAWAKLNQRIQTLTVNGQTGSAAVIQINGKSFVDLGMLVQVAGGSVDFRANEIVLTLPTSEKTPTSTMPQTDHAADSALSREFVRASIEEIGLLREWASPLAHAIQNGFPVNDSWVAPYRAKATDGLRMASSVASTVGDRNALQVLTREVENVRDWSNKLVEARESMNAANYAVSPTALRDEPMSQKIIACEQYLAIMLENAAFLDDPSCH